MTCLPGGRASRSIADAEIEIAAQVHKCTDFLPTPRLARYATSRPIVSILSPVVGRRGGAAPARTPVASGHWPVDERRLFGLRQRDLQRWVSKRMGATVTEVASSHVAMLSGLTS
jgi:hypothetical protein